MFRYRCIVLAAILYCGTAGAQPRKFRFTDQKMGSPFNIIMVTDDSPQAGKLADECFALVDSLNAILSDYDQQSELSLLSNTAGSGIAQKVSPVLWQLLLLAENAWHKSLGAFDITVGPLSAVWRKARKKQQFPSDSVIAAAKKTTGSDAVKLNRTDSSVLLLKKGMRLDPGGIAKGYIAQAVIDRLSLRGVQQALVDAGGDMAMTGAPPGSTGWTIGVNIPETTDELLPKKLVLQNKAVATSGDIYQYIPHNGKKYSHIIDPRTGYGITTQRNVTVIADDGAQADWLATVCSILPVKESMELAAVCHAEVLINQVEAGRLVSHATRGFERYWKTTE